MNKLYWHIKINKHAYKMLIKFKTIGMGKPTFIRRNRKREKSIGYEISYIHTIGSYLRRLYK